MRYLFVLSNLILGLCFSTAWSIQSAKAGEGDDEAVKACLKIWEKHPFNEKNPRFRTIQAGVRVIGIGKEVEDTKVTDKPALLLVKPAVSVMSKSSYKLMNPNGWYCVKGGVTVLGKSEIQLACKANLASSGDSSTVMGSSDHDGGVTVLGSLRVTRVGCDTK